MVDKLKFSAIHVHLTVPAPHSYNLPPVDLSIFPLISTIRSISVNYLPGEQFNWVRELCKNIIVASASSLQDLNFEWEQPDPDFPGLEGTLFAKLHKLGLNFKRNKVLGRSDVVERIGRAIAESCPKLVTLETTCAHLCEMGRVGVMLNFPG